VLKRINEIIEENSSFLVTSHEGPDGDAVGSSLALAGYLTELGKDVTIHFIDPVPEIYKFLPLAEKVSNMLPDKHYDVCFVLDVGEFRRAVNEIVNCKSIGMFVNIDHHKTKDHFGIINYIDPKAAATGVLIYRIIKDAGREISCNTALSIYSAIITDTGSFRYSNADPEAFSIAGEMVEKGVNPWNIAEHLYESQPKERLLLLARALATLDSSKCGKIGSLAVTLDMYEKTGASAELTDGFVNYPRSVRGVEVAIFFRELEAGYFKAGFRSKGKIDVSLIAAMFGGGGHQNAAGCEIKGSLAEVRKIIYDQLQRVL
jgi:phosphoesterase RecJ-like protein